MTIQMHIEILNSNLSDSVGPGENIQNSNTCIREVTVPRGANYENVLGLLGLNQETVLIFKDGQPLPLDARVMSGDLRIICIASNG